MSVMQTDSFCVSADAPTPVSLTCEQCMMDVIVFGDEYPRPSLTELLDYASRHELDHH